MLNFGGVRDTKLLGGCGLCGCFLQLTPPELGDFGGARHRLPRRRLVGLLSCWPAFAARDAGRRWWGTSGRGWKVSKQVKYGEIPIEKNRCRNLPCQEGIWQKLFKKTPLRNWKKNTGKKNTHFEIQRVVSAQESYFPSPRVAEAPPLHLRDNLCSDPTWLPTRFWMEAN